MKTCFFLLLLAMRLNAGGQNTDLMDTLVLRADFTEASIRGPRGKLNQTPNYLNVVVRSVTGLRASDLIHAQVISEAKHLLIHTKLSHKEVAAELGFSDQSYFTRFFRRETGERPLDWFRENS